MAPHTVVPEMLRAIWERNLPVIRERLEQLDQAASSALTGSLSESERELAVNNAHKLAGSLGMYGFPMGSKLARSIETLLEDEVPLDGAVLWEYVSRLREELE